MAVSTFSLTIFIVPYEATHLFLSTSERERKSIGNAKDNDSQPEIIVFVTCRKFISEKNFLTNSFPRVLEANCFYYNYVNYIICIEELWVFEFRVIDYVEILSV